MLCPGAITSKITKLFTKITNMVIFGWFKFTKNYFQIIAKVIFRSQINDLTTTCQRNLLKFIRIA